MSQCSHGEMNPWWKPLFVYVFSGELYHSMDSERCCDGCCPPTLWCPLRESSGAFPPSLPQVLTTGREGKMVSLWLGQRLHVRGLPSANADVYFIKPKKEKKKHWKRRLDVPKCCDWTGFATSV